MPAPKGTRCYMLPVSDTQKIHVYSSAEGIWIQLRRHVLTEVDIESPSFKSALQISPELAKHLSEELARAVDCSRHMSSVSKCGATALLINDSNAIHLYGCCDDMWLQLRREPSPEDLSSPTFRVALPLSEANARHLSEELALIAGCPGPEAGRHKRKLAAARPKPETCSLCKQTTLIEHLGRHWCPICGRFVAVS